MRDVPVDIAYHYWLTYWTCCFEQAFDGNENSHRSTVP